jgi:hypothetical protein
MFFTKPQSSKINLCMLLQISVMSSSEIDHLTLGGDYVPEDISTCSSEYRWGHLGLQITDYQRKIAIKSALNILCPAPPAQQPAAPGPEQEARVVELLQGGRRAREAVEQERDQLRQERDQLGEELTRRPAEGAPGLEAKVAAHGASIQLLVGERGELQAELAAAPRRPEELEGLYRQAEARAGVAEAGQLAARLAAAEKGGEGRRLAEAELTAARDQLAAQGKESREVQAKLNQVRSRCCLY